MRKTGLLALLLVISACTSPPSAQPAGPIAGPECADLHATQKRVTFGPQLTGVVFGTGKTGIVLAHQNGGSVCEWIPKATELATRGYRVLAFDFAGFGGSAAGNDSMPANIKAAVQQLRAEGTSKVVLIGASMGGTAAAVAAAEISPPVDGLITVSSPVIFNSVNAEFGLQSLTIPMLFVAASNDASFARAANELKAAAKKSSSAEVYLAEGSSAHGAWLIFPIDGHKGAIAAVDAFFTQHAPI
ncbi:alpha/beta hydrolase [Catelliglobosispora koreensis]|uniref:alpha/beta hydrolase n=1 Tax=Catelliglobosispora koreensis TaxID=129052 RepID=UPI0003632D80|nr:alpha/beta fold hydrolase [Catelliglobosispora koreensis]